MKTFYKSLLAVLVLVGLWGVVPHTQAQSTAWTAVFFANTTLSGTGVNSPTTYPAGTLNLNWGNGNPTDSTGTAIPGMPADNFSARFTSTQTLAAGTYDFIGTYDDGLRFFINGQLVIDDFNGGALRSTTSRVSLSGGVFSFVVEYVENTNAAAVQLTWVQVSASNITPTPAQPTATPLPPATGTVSGVKGLAVRTGPYLGASLVAVARPGTTYDILAQSNLERPFTWYLIRISDTKQGWASGRFLEVAGNLASVPEQATVFEQLDNAPDTGVTGATRAAMNLRVRPTTRANILVEIPWGGTVQILNRTRQGFEDFWYQVRYEGRVGWVLASYVGTKGSLDNVPVR